MPMRTQRGIPCAPESSYTAQTGTDRPVPAGREATTGRTHTAGRSRRFALEIIESVATLSDPSAPLYDSVASPGRYEEYLLMAA